MSRGAAGDDDPLAWDADFVPDDDQDDEEDDPGDAEWPVLLGAEDPTVPVHPDMDVVDDFGTIDDYIDEALGVVGPSRWVAVVDVQVLLIAQESVLLVRRANTGFCDGMWSPPTGRLRAMESVVLRAVREAEETLAVSVDPERLRFLHVTHYRSDSDRVVFVFAATAWDGEPANAEPHEHDALSWFPLDALPEETIACTVAAIANYRAGRPFSLLNWW
ncbi:NUDIX domain-containing protein [Spiractinospora alimapuensis]|uniref:NUDIX domain-containing protein n=1 Tax=Spiractinospora alimapuensis TaxID=2820884 RepID=UPI001F1BB45B|nr:NUDIX domain-containing protein [Spiractinospora alimapuensis]QVQ52606.1 NUDIX domain-containing protein [Spiractinospora alimapuensis]